MTERATRGPTPPELPRFAYETTLRSPAEIYIDTDTARAKRLPAKRRAAECAQYRPTSGDETRWNY